MTEFDNLKRSYIAAIETGLAANAGYQNCKFANEAIHKFCEILIDNSNYSNKTAMKQELELLKETLAKEIETCYQVRG